jgi:ABC-2 type transport system ATP-binding protein
MADRIGVIDKGELIVVEDKARLMRKLGKKQLTVVLRKPMTSLPAGLNAWPLTLSDDGHTLIYSFDSQKEESGIAELLRTLSEHDIDFKDLRSTESSLEDIFVSLVHKPTETQE